MSVDPERLKAVQGMVVARQFPQALGELEVLLNDNPDNSEVLYMVAVCRRYSGLHSDALETLEKLKRLAPGLGRAHQEEGHNYRETQRLDDALRAYGRACYYNPALAASLRAQIKILQTQGKHEACRVLQTQLDQLLALPKPLVAVMDLISQNSLLKAEDVCKKFLQRSPNNVAGMRLLAEIAVKIGVLEDAEYLLESVVEFEPENIPGRIDYIQTLRKRQKFSKALQEAKTLLVSDPDNPQFQSIYAIECMQTGDYDGALSYIDRILKKLPHDPVAHTTRGHACKTMGDTSAAIQSYKAAIAAHAYHGEAYYSLANLKTYAFSPEEIAGMHALEENSNLPHMDRIYSCFALGKAYEDNQDYERSFAYYKQGNSLKKAQSQYRHERMREDLQAQQVSCNKELFAKHKGDGNLVSDPIFIVGLPRAGSTLLEQILSSHSQVDGTLELPNILSLSQRLRRRRRTGNSKDYPENLHELTGQELKEFGEEYIRDTRIHRHGAPLFIDKMPNNFRHIGLIKLILPNAKIIDARRNPMACCFGGYKQLFAEGQEFTYSLQDIGNYYQDYLTLMKHWQEVLPGFVLTVTNEDMIDDFENQVRRMLDFCGLPFEQACLDYHKTQRNVRTPSSEQVRQPITDKGVDQWRHYEAHLSPLREILEGSVNY